MKQIIAKLAELKREGDYWDFKREPHENNANLLHDILCLANSLHIGDRYLIIGIDEEDDYNRFNLNQDGIKNRSKQADLIDFLSSKKFAGDNVPEVKLETLYYDNDVEIDVIVIKDNISKPYYITKDHRYGKETVRAGVIYSRVGDKNVPKNEVANIYKIEKMWKQRFGLDNEPARRMLDLLLNPNEWNKGYDHEKATYHKIFPEFSIEFVERNKNNDSLRYLFPDSGTSSIGVAKFNYQTTTLFELEFAYLDGYRTLIPVPEIKPFKRSRFYYFTKNSRKGNFLYFLNEKYEISDCTSLPVPIPIFEDKSELEIFLTNFNIELCTTDVESYISLDVLKEAEKRSGASLKLTIQIYDTHIGK